MKIAIVAPSPVPFAIGGAEKLWWGLQRYLNDETQHHAELIKLPSRELGLWELVDTYRAFAALDLDHFDLVISSKYPAWMVRHERHVCYLAHRLRGLYDTYALTGQPLRFASEHAEVRGWQQFAARTAGRREALDEGFARLAALRDADDLPSEALRFPGPFAREVVHWLDGIGLAPSAIARYAAISRNVARRAEYFPAGADVRVLPPPSDLQRLRMGSDDHLFTIGRLDATKRTDLLVRAVRLAKAEVPLLVAGTGPEEEALRALAAGDPRIRFLGFVLDREAERLYADALAVLFAPYDEDHGLVAIEAMACAKPVITTRDAGGPTDFVVDGETGFVVDPDPARIAERIDWLWEHRDQARALGLAGRERVRDVTWARVSAGLLDETPPAARQTSGSRRLKLTVATSFPLVPPEGGGQVRAFELYRHLARDMDVDVVSLGPFGGGTYRGEVAPGLRELRVPMSEPHAIAERELSRSLDWFPVTDVALPRLFDLTPEYVDTLRESAAAADVLVACHPYVLPALDAARPDAPLWYEAQDVEADLKVRVLPAAGRELLDDVRRVEADCCKRAALVWVCAREDGDRLAELYGCDRARTLVVPNGVDVHGVAYVAPEERARRQAALGADDAFTALFIGSWHPPNLEAARAILALAERLPALRFLVVGSVGAAFAQEPTPPNVGFMGVLDAETKALVLGIADVALNPMQSGSGTNLKMIEYCAAGIPVLSTPHGARGLTLRDEEHLRILPLEAFAQALDEARAERNGLVWRAQVARARAWVEQHYAWDRIAEQLVEEIRARGTQGWARK